MRFLALPHGAQLADVRAMPVQTAFVDDAADDPLRWPLEFLQQQLCEPPPSHGQINRHSGRSTNSSTTHFVRQTSNDVHVFVRKQDLPRLKHDSSRGVVLGGVSFEMGPLWGLCGSLGNPLCGSLYELAYLGLRADRATS